MTCERWCSRSFNYGTDSEPECENEATNETSTSALKQKWIKIIFQCLASKSNNKPIHSESYIQKFLERRLDYLLYQMYNVYKDNKNYISDQVNPLSNLPMS
jgi:hypothetical protein